jgi:hypothetical protein
VGAKHNKKHGLSRTREYWVWKSMRRRCYSPTDKDYRHYGGRGITVCPEWESFEVFLADMGHKPGPEYSLDRKRNHEGYSKGNCFWATKIEQSNNMRSNRYLVCTGRRQSVSRWAKELGLNHQVISYRLDHGYTPEQCLNPKRMSRWDSQRTGASQ